MGRIVLVALASWACAGCGPSGDGSSADGGVVRDEGPSYDAAAIADLAADLPTLTDAGEPDLGPCEIDCASDFSVGGNSACAVHDGRVACWGVNDSADGSPPAPEWSMPRDVAGITDAEQVSLGWSTLCTLAHGQIQCSGSGYGTLGDGRATGTSSTPVMVLGIDDAVGLDVGSELACAVRGSGTVACWGRNNFLGDGDGTLDEHDSPVTVVGLTDAAYVSVGSGDACAITTAGALWCWGSVSVTPLHILDDVTQAGGGDCRSCALRRNGRVACWACGPPMPLDVPGLSGAVSLAVGNYHACAVDSDGQTWCWGHNDRGQLGDGTTIDSYVPVLAHVPAAVRVDAYSSTTCALTLAGRIWCWGDDTYREAGTTSAYTPVPGCSVGDPAYPSDRCAPPIPVGDLPP